MAAILALGTCATAVGQIRQTSVRLGDALKKALEKTSLTGQDSRPFHIRVIVSEPANSQSPYQGTIEEWWSSPTEWRREVTTKQGIRQTIIVADGKKSERDEGDYFPLWMRSFVTALFDPQEMAPPLLNQIQEHILATAKTVLPRSKAGQACNYTLTLWKKLTRFLDYPRLELSTNVAENSMRPVAQGRKAWIHIGSPQAGPRVAAILSVVESCRRLNIPVRAYLAAILPGLADTSIQRVAQLTPAAWATRTQG